MFEPDGSSGTDAASDTGVADTSTDSSAKDTGAQETGVDAGVDAPFEAGPLTFTCGNSTVNDCSQCNGMPQPCVYCSNNNAAILAGACLPANQNCFNAAPNNFQDCNCNNPSACPESYQVCTGAGRCHTCEDNGTNNGLTCKSGGKCDAVDGGCF